MITAIIVAAGKGTRMGPDQDKLFLPLAGRPVVVHTWSRFDSCPDITALVIVIREGMQSAFLDLAGQYGFHKSFKLVFGGPERQDSVWNGLEAADPRTEIVAIHDAARPCVTHATITATVEAARETGAAVAAQKIIDTIKVTEDGRIIARTLDRAKMWSVQTPQTFRYEIIRRALAAARERGLNLTDDTAACELIGQPVQLVESPGPNPKVTLPTDLPFVETLLRTL